MDIEEIEKRLRMAEIVLARHSAVRELHRQFIARLAWGASAATKAALEADMIAWAGQMRTDEATAVRSPGATLIRETKHDAFLEEMAFLRKALGGA